MTSVLSRVEKDFRGRSIRVLVVDDAPAMREVLSAFVQASAELELVGCAHDGQEGVELEARLHPDLVLMDVQMPVLNGLDATRLIKQQPEAPLVVILSMDDRAANRAAARAVGADAFVGKEHLHTELRPCSAGSAARRRERAGSPRNLRPVKRTRPRLAGSLAPVALLSPWISLGMSAPATGS